MTDALPQLFTLTLSELLAIPGFGGSANGAANRLYAALENDEILRTASMIEWGVSKFAISSLPERARALSVSETRFVRSAVIKYTASLAWTTALISQLAQTSLDSCIDYVEKERRECRVWRPFMAWYESAAFLDNSLQAPGSDVAASKRVPAILKMAGYCYDVQQLGKLARTAINLLTEVCACFMYVCICCACVPALCRMCAYILLTDRCALPICSFNLGRLSSWPKV